MIAVLLVAAVMLAGITFGVFSFYYQPAEVYAVGAVCTNAGNATICQLTLANEGLDDTSTSGVCSLQDGSLMSGSVVGGGTVPAGGSLSDVRCVALGGSPTQGSQISGSMLMTNGASAFFTGTLD